MQILYRRLTILISVLTLLIIPGTRFPLNAQESFSAKPLLIERPELPKIPRALKKSKAQGIIVLKAGISHEGRVTGTEMISPSGLKVLDEFVEEWVHHWHYFPRIENGAKVDGFTIVTIRYDLENQKFIAPQPEESAEEAAGRMQFEVGAIIKPAIIEDSPKKHTDKSPQAESTETPAPADTPLPTFTPVPTTMPSSIPEPASAATIPVEPAGINRLTPTEPLDLPVIPDTLKSMQVVGDTKFYFSIRPDGTVENSWALSEKSYPEFKTWVKDYLKTTRWIIPEGAITGVLTAEVMVHFNFRDHWVQFDEPRIAYDN